MFDVETPSWYCQRGVPDLVVMGWAERGHDPQLQVHGKDAVHLWQSWIQDPEVILIGHGVAFDCAVMAQHSNPDAEPGTGWAYEQVFAAYADQRIQCTETRQRLLEMHQYGVDKRGYQLASILQRIFEENRWDEKKIPKEAYALAKQGVPSTEWPREIWEATPWRFKYGELRGVPLAMWPRAALQYALDDITTQFRLWEYQEAKADEIAAVDGLDPLADQYVEGQAAWDLYILRTPGFTVDRPRVQRLIELYRNVERACAEILVHHCMWCSERLPDGEDSVCTRCGVRETLREQKVVHRGKPNERIDESGKRKRAQQLVWELLGHAKAERTDGAVEREEPLGPDTCKADGKAFMRCVTARGGSHISTDDGVHAYQKSGADGVRSYLESLDPATGGTLVLNAKRLYSKAEKTRTSFLAHLDYPGRIRTSYQTVINTGRTSSRTPNVQNFPARTVKDPTISVRGCVVPSKGNVLIDSDYGQLELCHFAQRLTDMRRRSSGDDTYISSLAQAINEGKDGHVIIAAQLLRMPYDDAKAGHLDGDAEVCQIRQLSKVANYGYPGGMGPSTFVEFAAAQGVAVSLNQAGELKEVFVATWHEAPEYFQIMGQLCRIGGGKARVRIAGTNLVRGKIPFCAACNIQFQGPAARGCKLALRHLVDACYRDRGSALFGCRPLAFIHDEFLTEAPIDRAEAALAEQNRIMEKQMARYLPDVRIEAEGKIMQRWGK